MSEEVCMECWPRMRRTILSRFLDGNPRGSYALQPYPVRGGAMVALVRVDAE
jgi:hypothetical protein